MSATSRTTTGFVIGCAALVLLVGCGSADPPSAPTATDAQPASDAPAATDSAPPGSADAGNTGEPTPVGAAAAQQDPCLLLSPAEITTAAGVDVGAGQAVKDDARNITTCTYTGSEQAAVVVVGVSLEDGAESYDLNRELAPAYFGGDAEPVDVPGARRAYLVTEEELRAPVVGMLVADRFVQLQLGVEGADPAAAEQLAGLMAARLG